VIDNIAARTEANKTGPKSGKPATPRGRHQQNGRQDLPFDAPIEIYNVKAIGF
jgi:hypothetical protein